MWNTIRACKIICQFAAQKQNKHVYYSSNVCTFWSGFILKRNMLHHWLVFFFFGHVTKIKSGCICCSYCSRVDSISGTMWKPKNAPADVEK